MPKRFTDRPECDRNTRDPRHQAPLLEATYPHRSRVRGNTSALDFPIVSSPKISYADRTGWHHPSVRLEDNADNK